MPTHVKLIRAKDFIRATANGDLDLDESRRLLIEIVSAGGSLGDYDVLVDTRNAKSKLSTADVWHLAAELGKVRQGFAGRTAILCAIERFDKAKFFALCADIRGFQVRAFISFEDAMESLVSTDA